MLYPLEIGDKPQLTHKIELKAIEIPIKPQINPMHHFPNLDTNYLNFPFIIDKNAIEYISDTYTKVMFIMRGLSGSGKSTIVSIIKSVYKNVVTCSADDYFYRDDGPYVFDKKSLGPAHESCRQKAKRACQNMVPIVVIDNTNVRRWEIKFYTELASAHGYVSVKVQPKTPWQHNAQELAARNKHGCTQDVLYSKILKFDDIIPSYYGWFPNEQDSKNLDKLSADVFSRMYVKGSTIKRRFSKGT